MVEMHERTIPLPWAGRFKLEATTVDMLVVEQLASLLHKSAASIRSDASRNPEALPPICRLPGNKRLLWRREDVLAWLAQHVQSPFVSAPSLAPIERKRGRPRKIA